LAVSSQRVYRSEGKLNICKPSKELVLVLSVTRPKLPLSQILNDAACDVYSPKGVETLIQGECYGYDFLYFGSNIFSFGFIKAFDSKRNNKYVKKKKVLRQPWNALTLQLSLSLRDK